MVILAMTVDLAINLAKHALDLDLITVMNVGNLKVI